MITHAKNKVIRPEQASNKKLAHHQVDSLLDQEIEWCKKNPDKTDESEDFKRGFVGGLKQARTILRNAFKKI